MTDVEIPDAAIEAAEKAYWVAYSDAVRNAPSNRNGQGITERDARTAGIAGRRASIVAALEHLPPAPQAEGDVREAVGGVIANAIDHVISWDSADCRDCGTTPHAHPDEAGCAECAEPGWPCNYALALADAVLSSGLVVPEGEVEHEDYNAPHRDQRVTALRDEYTKVVQRQIKAKKRAQDERDAALAAVEASKADAWDEGYRFWYENDLQPGHRDYGKGNPYRDGCPAPSSIPARLLSGEHVGREVVLPDGTEGMLAHLSHDYTRTGVRVAVYREGTYSRPFVAADDVVTLVEDS